MRSDLIIKRYFKNLDFNDSIGHAFLFSNSSYDELIECMEETFNKYIFKRNLSTQNNPDIYIIGPEKNVIKKEAIKDLEEELSKTSQINESKIYIIKECDKLNDYSANSLLKILEEPPTNIYAFLFTKNIEKVLPTIKSRCQIIQKTNEKVKNIYELYDEKTVSETLSILNKIERNKEKTIAYSNELYKNVEKEKLTNVLNIVQYFYKDCLNKINDIDLEYFAGDAASIEKVVMNNDEKRLISKIIIINKNLNLLNYNLNINSFIDKILIELGRV